MNGTNSLRAGVRASEVIENFKEIKELCLANDIRPIFLTLPPINPDNIARTFNEPTADDWQEQFTLVNDFLRTQVHIDVAAYFADNALLPTMMGLDGLHGQRERAHEPRLRFHPRGWRPCAGGFPAWRPQQAVRDGQPV